MEVEDELQAETNARESTDSASKETTKK